MKIEVHLHDLGPMSRALKRYAEIHPNAEVLFALTVETNNDDHEDYIRFPILHVRAPLKPLCDFAPTIVLHKDVRHPAA